MPVDREQVRRVERRGRYMAENTANAIVAGFADEAADALHALLAELEQAERVIQVVRDNAATVESNLRHQIELEQAAWEQRDKDAKAYLTRAVRAERERDEARADLSQAQQHIQAVNEDIAFTAWMLDEQLTRTNAAEDERLASLQARLAAVAALVEKIASGRHSFEMLRHHQGNDKATIAWARTVVRECAGIFAAAAAYEQPQEPNP